ncbi:hypothetical protein CHS0354_022114 [Potamilus streckersoni]|uniref:Glutathione S-transferase n=1 Tax=Potamilus streckersoni TaxID=2493646 RepID=A0AAE0SAJ3_9BIVA|nr:hypothetical protein CHS0354_022114 [Potamilus streckersoni]
MAPKYKLMYFDGRGRAEISRLLFHVAGVEFEDKRVKREDWPALKEKLPQKQMPVLEIDGKTMYCQSMAIARYLAREFKLYGKSSIDAFSIDEIVDTVGDLSQEGMKTFFEKDEAKKAELMKKFLEETVPRQLGFLEAQVKKYGKNGFAVGSEISLADIVIFNGIEGMRAKEAAQKFPKLSENLKKTEENPKIKKWLKDRPVTEF